MKRICIATCLCLAYAITMRTQDPLQVAAEVYQAVDQLKNAYADIIQVKEIVQQIELGHRPPVTQNRWTDLAAKYDAATKSDTLPQNHRLTFAIMSCDKKENIFYTPIV